MDTEKNNVVISWSNKPADKDGYYLYVRFNTTHWRAFFVNSGRILQNQDPDQFYADNVPVLDFEPGFWCGPIVNPHRVSINDTLTWTRPQAVQP